MKILFGVLCLATFGVTSAAYHPVQPNLETEVTESVSADSSSTQEDQSEEVQKATSLIAVTTKDCRSCRRLKYRTITTLLADGYDVSTVPQEEWDGPDPNKFPTLYYYELGKIIRVEEGFKTASHVKKYLKK